MSLNLRNRIAFFYMSASAILIMLLFVIIYVVVHSTVYDHIDQNLVGESIEMSTGFTIVNDNFNITNAFEWLEKEHETVESDPIYVQLTDKDGKIVRKTANLMDGSLVGASGVDENTFTNTEFAGRQVRQAQVPVKNSTGNIIGYILVAKPHDEANLVLLNLRKVLIISYPLVILILFFATNIIAGKSIVPIKAITKSAEKITKENLHERIELPAHKDELFTLTTTINSLLERLEDAVLRERQFTADASHELRTPLSILKGTMEVLIRKPRDVEQYEKKISYCIREVNRIANIVDQLLMLARIESGNIEPQTSEINLNDSIKYSVLKMQDYAEDHKIKINIDAVSQYFVKADSAMLGSMLENLISNSIKYSNGSQKIDVKLEKSESCINCSIKDYGVGMKQEQIKRFYNRFYKNDDSRNSEFRSHGIGLAIVKRLADIQNIDIVFTSEHLKGTTATISFLN